MKHVITTFFLLITVLVVYPQQMGNLINQQVILNSSQSRPHLLNAFEPTAVITGTKISNLQVSLDPAHYSSYTITVTPSDGSNSSTIVPSSAVVSIPITENILNYAVTIDGGDYGLYDGVFNTSGDSVTITDALAHKIVENRRQINSDVNFAFYTLNSLVNDSICCIIDSIPSEAWASGSRNKCLVFVDESPLKGWGHDCSYYYIPRQMSMSDSLSVLLFNGKLPPRYLCPTSVKMSVQTSLTDFKAPSLQFKNILHANAMNINNSSNSKYIIIGPSYFDNSGGMYSNKWNHCSAMYTILRHKYNVSANDIYVLLGNEDGTMIWFYNSTGNYDTIPMPRDLDGDGYDENILPATAANVINVFDTLSDKNATGHIDQLFLYYGGDEGFILHDDETDLYDVQLIIDENGAMPSGQLADLIYQVDVDFVSSYLDIYNSSYFGTYLGQDHVVMSPMHAFWNYVGPVPRVLNPYSYYWLSALAEADLETNQYISSDTDNNGIVTFREVINKADTIFMNYCASVVDTTYFDFYEGLESVPDTLVDSLAIDYAPTHSLLRIFRNSSEIYWDSPDIWIRNQNDGFTNQENDHLKLVDGQPLYIYVRVHNIGNLDSTPLEKSIKLFGAPISECSYEPVFFETDNVGYEIGTIEVDSISAGGSKIFCYQWNWYEDYDESGELIGQCDWQELYSNSGNVLPVRVLALIGDERDFGRIGQYQKYIPDTKWTVKDHVAIQPRKGALFNESYRPLITMPTTGSHFDIPVDGYLTNMEIIVDSIRSTNAQFHNGPRVLLELSDNLYSALNNGGTISGMTPAYSNPKKFVVNSNHAQISNVSCGYNNYIRVHCDISTLLHLGSDSDWYFYIVFKNSDGDIVRGYTVHSFVKGEGNTPITPFAIATPMGNNSYTLSETNINEPARYEWHDAELNKFDEGKTITANKTEIGDLAILKVTRTSDNSEQYAVAILDGVPTIASVSPIPFDNYVSAMLTDNAVADMSISIVPVVNNVSSIVQSISEGCNNVMINTASLPAGQYILCLMHNNTVVRSMNIIKAVQ